MTLASTPRQYSTQSGGTLRASTLPRAGRMAPADETRAPWRSLRAVGIILSYSQTRDVGEIKALIISAAPQPPLPAEGRRGPPRRRRRPSPRGADESPCCHLPPHSTLTPCFEPPSLRPFYVLHRAPAWLAQFHPNRDPV